MGSLGVRFGDVHRPKVQAECKLGTGGKVVGKRVEISPDGDCIGFVIGNIIGRRRNGSIPYCYTLVYSRPVFCVSCELAQPHPITERMNRLTAYTQPNSPSCPVAQILQQLIRKVVGTLTIVVTLLPSPSPGPANTIPPSPPRVRTDPSFIIIVNRYSRVGFINLGRA
jgi:hypothetical protein